MFKATEVEKKEEKVYTSYFIILKLLFLYLGASNIGRPPASQT